MKLMPVMLYIKRRAEESKCDQCHISITFSNVQYNDSILERGGCVLCQGYCKECGEDHMEYIPIKPVKDEYLN